MTATKKISSPQETIIELVDSCHSGDIEKLQRLFSPNALMTGYFNGEFYSGSPEPFFAELRDNPCPASTGAEYIGEILSVEEFGDIAQVTLKETGYLGADFINLFQLVYIDESWLIFSKAYIDQ
jgi:hypothetical protein